MKDKSELDGLLFTAGSTGALALIVGIARGIIIERHGGLRPLLRGVLASVVVGVISGLAIDGSELPLSVRMAFVGVCSFLADDVLAGFLVLGSLFRENPSGFIFKVLDSIRGKGTPTDQEGK